MAFVKDKASVKVEPLEVGDEVIVTARSRHSDGSHGVITGMHRPPGAALRYTVEFSRGPRLSYTRHELIKDNRRGGPNG